MFLQIVFIFLNRETWQLKGLIYQFLKVSCCTVDNILKIFHCLMFKDLFCSNNKFESLVDIFLEIIFGSRSQERIKTKYTVRTSTV